MAGTTLPTEEHYEFSTGLLYLCDQGEDPTDDDRIAVVESASLDIKFNKKDLSEVPSQSMFAVATGFFGGQCLFKFDHGTLSGNLLQRAAGAVKSAGTGSTIYTVGAKSRPKQHNKLVYIGQTTEEKDVTVRLYDCNSPGVGIAMRLEDFAKGSQEFEGYPSALDLDENGDGKVCSIEIAD